MPPPKRKGSQKKSSSPKGKKMAEIVVVKEPVSKKSRNTVSGEFITSLITTKCNEFKLKELYTVKKLDKVSVVWGKLIEKMIMAAPVVSDTGMFEGFIDTIDIASYLVAKFGEPMLRANVGAERLSAAMTAELKTWMDKTVADVMEFPNPNKIRDPPVCYANYSLLSALEPLAMVSGLHRVAVVESPESNRLVTIITQSQALEYIHNNVSHLGSRKGRPVEECVDVVKPEGIFVVTKEHIALDAFQHMLKHGVSALAVVSEPKGHIKGVIALRDLQVIGSDAMDLWKLYTGVESFLKFKTLTRVITVAEKDIGKDMPPEIKGEDAMMEITEKVEAMQEEKTAEPEPPKDMKTKKKTPAIELLPSSLQCVKGETFMSAIKKLTAHKVHRLFVTDEDKIPFGVVSIKEVLKELLH